MVDPLDEVLAQDNEDQPEYAKDKYDPDASIIDEFMDDFVNSYVTASVVGQQGVNIQLDRLVREKVTKFYNKLMY